MTLCGIAWAGTMILFSPSAFGWLTPAWLGLIGAAPLVKYSSSATWGGLVSRKFGLLQTPSSAQQPPLLEEFAALESRSHQSIATLARSSLTLALAPPQEQPGDMPCQSFRHHVQIKTEHAPPTKEPH